jgi:hypothetical protein
VNEALRLNGDFSVVYQLNVLNKNPRKTSMIYSQLNQAIQDAFNEAGIEILSPAYASVPDGNHITIPEEHLPSDYQPSGFKVSSLFASKGGKRSLIISYGQLRLHRRQFGRIYCHSRWWG